jgi:hypothetical protein
MANLLEFLYAASAVCVAVALYHAWRARGHGVRDPHARRMRVWGTAAGASLVASAALYAWIGYLH